MPTDYTLIIRLTDAPSFGLGGDLYGYTAAGHCTVKGQKQEKAPDPFGSGARPGDRLSPGALWP